MPQIRPSRSALRGRRVPRSWRLVLLLALLFIVGVLLYLNRVGLPRYFQASLRAELRARGVFLELGRLRLAGFREWVAEEVRIRAEESQDAPSLFVNEARFRLKGTSWWRFKFEIENLRILNGLCMVPVASAEGGASTLSLERIHAELRFRPDHTWDLVQCAGQLLNARLEISGSLTNVLAFRKPPPPSAAASRTAHWPQRLQSIATRMKELRLAEGAALRLRFYGDGATPGSLGATLSLTSARTAAPWGEIENLQMAATLSPSPDGKEPLKTEVRLSCDSLEVGPVRLRAASLTGDFATVATNWPATHGQWHLAAQNIRTPWATSDHARLSATTAPVTNRLANYRTDLRLDLAAVRTPWVEAKENHLQVEIFHSLTNFSSWDGAWQLGIAEFRSTRGNSREAHFSGTIKRRALKPEQRQADATWAWWRKLEPFALDWEGRLTDFQSGRVTIEKIHWAGRWDAPKLSLIRLHAQVQGRPFESAGRLDVRTREWQSQMNFDFDLHAIAPLLTTNAQRWLKQFHWESPPAVAADVSITFPPWTYGRPSWRDDILPSVTMTGSFQGGPGAFRGVSVNSARSRFTLTNFVWRLPDLTVIRPEGAAHLDYTGDMRTRDYHWGVHSQIDPKALIPVLKPSERRAVEFFAFSQPPVVRGEIWGQWFKPERAGFQAHVTATNFSFRGEAFSGFSAATRFTNLVLELAEVRLDRGSQRAVSSQVRYDIPTRVVEVTNAVSTMDPALIKNVIGPKVYAAIAPYRFGEPPTVLINGRLPTRDEEDADAHFQVAGKSFRYWKFNVPEISADLHWKGTGLAVTNLRSRFYQGQLALSGQFDFASRTNARFGFQAEVKEADLRSLMADVTATNTTLEGMINGSLLIASALSDDWKSWRGLGKVRLRDGFLWNIPIFGLFSPLLNRIAPGLGLGNSRVSDGSARFEIEGGVIRTGSLELRSPAMRLQYAGDVDFQGRVEARVQAEILRDAWAVGRVVSLALWPLTKVFEYRVTGTLQEPKSEPLHLPKFLFWPFQPLQALKNLLSLDEAPPALPPPKASPAPKD